MASTQCTLWRDSLNKDCAPGFGVLANECEFIIGGRRRTERERETRRMLERKERRYQALDKFAGFMHGKIKKKGPKNRRSTFVHFFIFSLFGLLWDSKSIHRDRTRSNSFLLVESWDFFSLGRAKSRCFRHSDEIDSQSRRSESEIHISKLFMPKSSFPYQDHSRVVVVVESERRMRRCKSRRRGAHSINRKAKIYKAKFAKIKQQKNSIAHHRWRLAAVRERARCSLTTSLRGINF